jgi:hypothetical protein
MRSEAVKGGSNSTSVRGPRWAWVGLVLIGALAPACRKAPTENLTPAQCEAKTYSGTSASCRQCVCKCDATAAAGCGKDCWALMACVRDKCKGDSKDMGCMFSKCRTLVLAGRKAASVATCAKSCVAQCGTANSGQKTGSLGTVGGPTVPL